MKRVAFRSLWVVASLVVGGCGSEMDIGEDGIAFEVDEVGPAVDELITDCPKYFPSSDRSIWQTVAGENVYIDAYGRPNKAYKNLPPMVAGARDDTCQGNIGSWGDAANPSNDYDGGHMIGSQLGGYGRRANIVPQDANFNRGVWLTLENKMANCYALPTGRLQYYITVTYPNTTTLIPSKFYMKITNRSTGSYVNLSFDNLDGGGANGATEKSRGITFLTNQGCY